MPNSSLPIAIGLLLMSKSSPGGIPSLGGLIGRSGTPIRIAPTSIPELENTLEGMLGALHTIDKFRDFKSLAETLSAGSELVKMLDKAKTVAPTPAALPEFSSVSREQSLSGLPDDPGYSEAPSVSQPTNNFQIPDLSKIMEIAGPMISAINSPK